MQASHTGRRKRVWRILIALGFTAMGIAAVMVCVVFFGFPAPIQARIDILPDRNAVDGSLHAEGGGNVADGEFWVMFNQLPTIPEGSQECNLEFENPEANHYGARVNLYLKSTGRRLGGTRLVDAGKYVETVKLAETFPAGEYPVVAKIELFSGREPVGEMSFDITLRVIKKDGTE